MITLSNYNIASVIANVYKGFGNGRLQKDPRFVSESIEKHLRENELYCQIGAEVECFVFDDIITNHNASNRKKLQSSEPKIISMEQYGEGKYPIRSKDGYDIPPSQDSLIDFRFKVSEVLKRDYSIQATNLIHEVASSGQIEINFIHDTLTKTADNVQVFKDVVRNTAKQHDKVANKIY